MNLKAVHKYTKTQKSQTNKRTDRQTDRHLSNFIAECNLCFGSLIEQLRRTKLQAPHGRKISFHLIETLDRNYLLGHFSVDQKFGHLIKARLFH
jgi:hypothetical protein